MKRNMELIRKILIRLESGIVNSTPNGVHIRGIPEYTKMEVDYHLRLLSDPAYIEMISDGRDGRVIRRVWITKKGRDYLKSLIGQA